MVIFCDGECVVKRVFGGYCDCCVCYLRLYGGVYYYVLVVGVEWC